MPETAFWPQLREALAGSVPVDWLNQVHGASSGTPGRLLLTVSTATAEAWIGHEYGPLILMAVRKLGHDVSRLEFRVLQLEPSPAAESTSGKPHPYPEATTSPAASEPWAKVPLAVLSDSSMSSNAVRVWAALATFNGYREKYPALRVIGARSGLCERSVRKALRELETGAYLQVEGRRGGRGCANVYILLPGKKGGQPCRVSLENPAQIAGNPGTGALKRGPTVPPNR